MKTIAYLRVSSLNPELVEDMKRVLEKSYKDLLSESIKRGIAAKKLNKK